MMGGNWQDISMGVAYSHFYMLNGLEVDQGGAEDRVDNQQTKQQPNQVVIMRGSMSAGMKTDKTQKLE